MDVGLSATDRLGAPDEPCAPRTSPATIIADEPNRLAALRRLGILDTAPEERYDRLARLAAAALDTPIALISIVDEHRQWFKARVGLDAPETPRELAFCAHAIAQSTPGPFVVEDATADDRFADNPLVTGHPDIRFYAGQVVRDPDGWPMGTICAIDNAPRRLGEADRQVLVDLALLVEQELARTDLDDAVIALHQSDHRKAALLDTMTEGLIVQDLDGAIVEWNTAATEVLGLSDDELSGRTSSDPRWRTVHVDGSPWPGEEHPAIQALRTGEPAHARTMGVHRPDGTLVWLRVNARPVRDRAGRIQGVVTLFTDIAAEFDSDRAAEKIALRLRQAVDSSGIGTALLDSDGSMSFVNTAFTEIVGLGFEQLLGRRPAAWIHPDDPLAAWDQALDSHDQRNATAEIRVGHHEGPARWVRAHIALLDGVEDRDGDRYIIQLEDVTERRELQQRLQASEQVARASLESLEQGVIVADATGHIHQSNMAAVDILGYTPDALTAEFRSDRWTTYDEFGNVLPDEQRPITRIIAGEESVRGAIVGWRHQAGHIVLLRISCTAVAVSVDDPDDTRFVVAFADVTEEHRAKRLLDSIFATAPVGLAVVDADDTIVRCNPTFGEHTGFTPAEVTGQRIAPLLNGPLGPPASDGVRTRDERLLPQADGTERWVTARHAHIETLDRPLDIVATFDVTERKRLEMDLQRFGIMFRHATDIITVVDQTGRVKYASPSNARILGYPDGFRSAGGVLDLVHPDDLAEAALRFTELIAGRRGTEPFTMRVQTFDGEWKSIETVGQNLLDEPSIEGVVLTSRDVTERQALTEQLAYRASHDALTGLPNRATAEERLRIALGRARRDGRVVGLCFLDLDRFKSVNDLLGHAAGDTVLVEVATRLQEVVRDSDLPARLGGDEFVVVLDLVDDASGAELAAHRIARHLATPPISVGDLEVSVSIGVAISEPGDTTSTLLSRADTALYRAKADRFRDVCIADAPALQPGD